LAATSTIDTADFAGMPLTNWRCYDLPSGGSYTINTADFAGMPLAYWWCHSLPAGGTYTIDTADFAGMPLIIWYCHSLPAGGTYTIDTADFAGMSPIIWYCYSMPFGAITNVAQNGFANFTKCTSFRFDNNSLSQSDVDTALWSLYQATVTPRTASGGTINVGGSNAAPSGTFQAASACPVTISTDGKEIAYELLNDSCGVGFNKWSIVTITT